MTFLRRCAKEADGAKIERRDSIRNRVSRGDIHHLRSLSLDDAIPRMSASKDERISAAKRGLRNSTTKFTLQRNSFNGLDLDPRKPLIISGLDGAVPHKAQMPRRKSKVKAAIALHGVAIVDSTSTKSPMKDMIPVYIRHDNFTQSESQVALTFKHELRVSRTMTVRQLMKNINTVGVGKNGIEVISVVLVTYEPGELSTRNWSEVSQRGMRLNPTSSARKKLCELDSDVRVILVDVMSTWDDDFEIDVEGRTSSASGREIVDGGEGLNLPDDITIWDNETATVSPSTVDHQNLDDVDFGDDEDDWGDDDNRIATRPPQAPGISGV